MEHRYFLWVSMALWCALYLIYSSTFTFDYLTNDEVARIGRHGEIWEAVARGFFAWGRGLFGAYETIVYEFAGYDTRNIQIVRFLNFLSLSFIGMLLYFFLWKTSKSLFLAFFSVLFFFSHSSIQSVAGYSLQLISNVQPAVWLSLLAFYLHFYLLPRKSISTWIGHPLIFVIFIAALQSTQTYAFFSVIPLSFLVLNSWNSHHRRTWSFLAIILIAFATAVISYKLGLEYLHQQGKAGYRHGESSMESVLTQLDAVILKAMDPHSYWSVMKIWNYPFPFHAMPALGRDKATIGSTLAYLWLALLFVTSLAELARSEKGERRSIALKWGSVILCIGVSLLFTIADSPIQVVEHRPHMTLVPAGVVIFTAAYALLFWSRFVPTPVFKGVLTILVIINAFGAQSAVSKAMVDIRADQLDFIRTELLQKPLAEYDEIIVALPPLVRVTKCFVEPCDHWFGQVMGWEIHEKSADRYKYALSTLGVPPHSKKIRFVQIPPDHETANQIIIDWHRYFRSKQLVGLGLRSRN